MQLFCKCGLCLVLFFAFNTLNAQTAATPANCKPATCDKTQCAPNCSPAQCAKLTASTAAQCGTVEERTNNAQSVASRPVIFTSGPTSTPSCQTAAVSTPACNTAANHTAANTTPTCNKAVANTTACQPATSSQTACGSSSAMSRLTQFLTTPQAPKTKALAVNQ